MSYSAGYKRGVTNCCQISYTPTEILFEINEITRFLKSEIKKLVWKLVKSRKFTLPVLFKISVTLIVVAS